MKCGFDATAAKSPYVSPVRKTLLPAGRRDHFHRGRLTVPDAQREIRKTIDVRYAEVFQSRSEMGNQIFSCEYQTNNCFSHRSEEHTSELQSQSNLVCRLLLETKN